MDEWGRGTVIIRFDIQDFQRIQTWLCECECECVCFVEGKRDEASALTLLGGGFCNSSSSNFRFVAVWFE